MFERFDLKTLEALLGLYPRPSTRALVAVSVMAALMFGESYALAQTISEDAQVLAELNDDDYQVRLSATHRLLADEALTQDDLARLFEASESPEQRHRLLGVSKHLSIRNVIHEKFKGLPGQGSMGLSHQMVQVTELGETPRRGALVVQTLPGFPAYAVLEPGDVVVSFAGQPLPDKLNAAQFREMILRFKAHDTISLTILREGNPIDLLFELEHGKALSEAYDAGGMVVKSPYRDKWLAARARLLALREPSLASDPAKDGPLETPGSDPPK